MKKMTKIKKTLAAVLAMCLVVAYFPLQASAEDVQTVTIASQEAWDELEESIGADHPWPAKITIDAPGQTISPSAYVVSDITLTNGTFTVNYNVGGTVAVSGGEFVYSGQGNPIRSVTVTGGKFTNEGAVQSLQLSTGGFVNNGTVSGTVIIDGGTFANDAGGTVISPVLLSGGYFDNNGAIGTLELSGGEFTIWDSGTQGSITMSGGTVLNKAKTEIFLNINGQGYTLADSNTLTEVLTAPAGLQWTQESEKTNATASWSSVADAGSYKVTLYKSGRQIGGTQTVADISYDFTSEILAGGYGTYTFQVQALADGKVASPVISSGDFEYKGPSGDVTTDDYAWDAATQTLTIKTDSGCRAWQSDTSILGTLISDDSFGIVKHAVLGPKVNYIRDNMLPCTQLETLIVQSTRAIVSTHWASKIPASANAYCSISLSLGHFPGKVESFQCRFTGIEDGQVFKGRAPDGFTLYGIGTNTTTDDQYMKALAWEVTKADDGKVSGSNFIESPENTYTVDDLKLNHDDYGTYTLTVTYQPQKYTDGAWSNDGNSKTVSATFTIEPEGGSNPVYPPAQRYTIISSADPGGTITPDGSTTVSAGLSASYRIEAAEGYDLKDVLVDGKSVGPLTEYTFERVYADHTIHAVFEKKAGGDDPLEPDNPEKPGKPNKPGTPADKPNGRPGTSGKPGSGTVSTGSGTTGNTPKTGDESDLLLWIVLAAAAGGTTLVLRKRRDH
ncbi:LPXTG cell wall anchor domain-containing protein [Emergencia sp.]|uniref:LPXTG cell wall anchor domain-containing protein n=1 Tax=Emergencia sp. TaxID=1926557 RepID=UPI003AF16EAB